MGVTQAAGQYASSYLSTRSKRDAATQADQQGAVARKKAYDAAGDIERQSKDNMRLAAANIGIMRQNETAKLSAIRNNQVTTGFTTQGTGNTVEQNAQAMLDAEIANATTAASNASLNAYSTAAATRHEGDIAAMQAHAAAEGYRQQSKYERNAAHVSLMGSLLSSALSAYQGAMGAQNYNAAVSQEADKRGLTGEAKDSFLNQYQTSVWQAGLAGAVNGGNAGFQVASSLNPATAASNPTTVQDWNKLFATFGWGNMRKYTTDEKNNPFNIDG